MDDWLQRLEKELEDLIKQVESMEHYSEEDFKLILQAEASANKISF